jgi:hypothetical protein
MNKEMVGIDGSLLEGINKWMIEMNWWLMNRIVEAVDK